MPCAVCGRVPSENAHTKSRATGGTYQDIIPLCHKHHRESHDIGLTTFATKYNLDLVALAKRVCDLLDTPSTNLLDI